METDCKYALITGASSGIGWNISEILAEKGYSVIAVSNQPEKLDDLKTNLEKAFGIQVVTLNIDLSLEDSPLQIFDFCKKNNLIVEILVNNAGTLIFEEAIRVDYSRTKSILNLHVATPALLCRLFGEQMVKRGKGYILNVSSITSVMPYPTISLYGPTKAFLRFYTRSLRTEMKHYGIWVTCLIPGATLTSLYDPGKYNTPIKITLGIIKKPETVARAGVNALFRNRPECIPGFLNKLIVLMLPFIPGLLIGLIYNNKIKRLSSCS